MDLTTLTLPWKSKGRAKKKKNQTRDNQPNSGSKGSRPATKGSIQRLPKISDIKLDRPHISLLKQHPVLHIPPDRLLADQPHIASSEPSSTQKQTRVSRDTLEIISIQLRLNPFLSSQILTPRQIQGNKLLGQP